MVLADPGPDAPPIEYSHGYGDNCPDFHRTGVELRDTQRRAYCKTCGIEVDIFDYLHRLAQDWAWVVQRYRDATNRAKRAEARLEEALRLERNARGRLKRLVEKERRAS